MAAVNFPNPAATNPDTGAPYSAGWYNADNGVTYVYEGNAWKAATVNNADFNDIYVNETGDNMTGNLTLGTDKVTLNAADGSADFAGDLTIATDKIELKKDGSASFLGKVGIGTAPTGANLTVKSPANQTNIGLFESTGATLTIRTQQNAGSSEAAINAYEGSVGATAVPLLFQTAGVERMRLETDGSATFAGDVTAGSGTHFFGTAGAAIRRNAEPGATILCQFDSYATGTTNYSTVVNISTDGSASFAGRLNVETSQNGGFAGVFKNTTDANANGIYIHTPNRNGTTALKAIRIDDSSGEKASISTEGSAYFAGTITTQGGAGGPYVAIGETITFNTEADNPANYTTTMVDGEEQQVYNGPTLDVKERLTKADVALQNLKTAVATAVDFAELKAAMTTALADI